MSWDLVRHLQQRFPEIEPFPRGAEAGGDEQAPRGVPSGAPTAPTAPAKPGPKHEAHGPTYLVPGAYLPAAQMVEIARVLRYDAPFRMDYCSFVSAVDRPEQAQIEVVYHLFSTETHGELLLKVRLPRQHPRIASVTPIWPGANWHERETFDLFGVVFEGHPDLRRIMMTEDWQGHPLRKDYVYQEPRWLEDLAAQRQREIEGLRLGERG
jgi:NADH-quinone oxidoreductase subunit C